MDRNSTNVLKAFNLTDKHVLDRIKRNIEIHVSTPIIGIKAWYIITIIYKKDLHVNAVDLTIEGYYNQ